MLLPKETKERFGINTETLKPQANKPAMVRCDYCGFVFETLYHRWRAAQKHNPKTACKSCRGEKRKETTQILHGVDNISQTKTVIKKRKEAWDNKSPEEKKENQARVRAGLIKNQGCIPFESPEFQEKIRNDRELRTGYRNPWNDPEILEKRKQTFLEKYGHETPAKADCVRKKIRKTRVGNRQTRIIKGRDLKQIAKENGFSYSGICARIQKFGIQTLENLKKEKSGIEFAIETMLTGIGVPFEFRIRNQNRELDFFLPDHNLGIEADGLYWHSDAKEPNKAYHKEKKAHFEQQGIEVLFFRENEIMDKINIIQSIVLNKIGRSKKIGARKTQVKILPPKETKAFFELNHLMGHGRGKTLALQFQEEVVAALQYFQKSGEVEVSRFCCKKETQVMGGLSKLLKPIQAEHPNLPITSFVDLRYGNGKSLQGLGFIKTQEHLSFCWVKNLKTFHRLTFPGNSGYDQKCSKLWDCGQAKYEHTQLAASGGLASGLTCTSKKIPEKHR